MTTATRSRLTRARIVDAARVVVEASGHEHLSLRKLATDLRVTAPALYDHVASKDELLRAVAVQGYEELGGWYRADASRPIERVRGRAVAYVDFAMTHPELFRVMFMYRPAAVEIEADNELGAASDVFELGLVDIERAIADGDLTERPAVHHGLTLWTVVHGVATVSLIAPPVGVAVCGDVIDAMLAGLRPSTS